MDANPSHIAVTRRYSIAISVIAVTVVLLTGHVNGEGNALSSTPVIVQLRLNSRVTQRLITIADIAEITGGDPVLRQRIGELDLDELPENTDSRTFDRFHVEIRIRMDRVSTDRFQVIGPASGRVTLHLDPISDQTVTEAILQPLARQWSMPASDISVRLTSPLPDGCLPTGFVVSPDKPVRLEPFLSTHAIPGLLSVRMGVYEQQNLISTFIVSVEARVTRSIPIALRSLTPGERLTTEDVTFETREMTGQTAIRLASYEDLNKFAARQIPAGQPIQRDALSASPTEPATASRVEATRDALVSSALTPEQAEPSPAVPAGSPVVIIYRRNSLKLIHHNAELVRAAKVGNIVSVKNLNSKMTVRGRLISPTEVEVLQSTP